MKENPVTLTRRALEEWMSQATPDNDDPENGFALVNVLPPGEPGSENIPGSINVPGDRLALLEDRFARGKNIILYSVSQSCPASGRAAEELARRGFEKVFDYAGGMAEWKSSGEIIDTRNEAH